MKKTNKLLVWFLGAYYRSGIRGSWWLTSLLAEHISGLQNIRLSTENGLIYLDLRIEAARGILADPISRSGEDAVMKSFVRPGDVVFDVGAHLGFYTLVLSKLSDQHGKVYAFEPNPELLPTLKQTIAHLPNVKLFELALSAETGESELFVPEDASMASISNWTDGIAGNVHSVSCETRALEEMIEAGEVPLPTFIKCDVEGAELSVFAGARKILDRVDAPIVLFELNRKAMRAFGDSPEDCRQFLVSMKSANYSFFEVRADEIKKVQSWDIAYTNILAVPASRLS